MPTDEYHDPADYSGLLPDTLLNAIDSCGLQTDGRLLALNSYENRVYQAGIESGTPVIVKFYRPGRWTDAAILEEHTFSLELVSQELPVVAPLKLNGTTLQRYRGYRFALYPRQGGYWPELGTQQARRWTGRVIARMHAVGAAGKFRHRPELDIDSHGHQSRHFLLEQFDRPATQLYWYEGPPALGYVYDQSVSDAFRRRLSREDCKGKWIMLEVIADNKDPGHLAAFKTIMAESTDVNTKVWWIEQMIKVHPREAVPYLKQWADSPNKWLATVAGEALAKVEKQTE